MCTSHELQRLCCQQTRHKQKQHKRHVISPTSVTTCSAEHFLKCFLTVALRVNCLSHKPQENCLYPICTNSAVVQKRFGHSLLRLHSFMSLNVYLELLFLFAAEFLVTNDTRELSNFIVWLQQMCLELIKPCKTDWTVSTWVRLCISVNTNMKLQLTVNLKQHPTVRTFIRSTVAVYTTFMSPQAAGVTETLVTQWTLVRFLSRVDSHVFV